MTDREITEDVLEEFSRLSAIPRPSGHEKQVSDYLRDRLAKLGFHVVQDEHFNIIADKPAAPGYENAPLTILQGHMDMVCVARDGYEYDPLTDAIKLQRNDNILTAVGTSLGADDGIGVAMGIYVLQNAVCHGRLRLIVTVDEERGMTGAVNLSPNYLQSAKYLINCDSTEYDLLINGSAGGIDLEFTGTCTAKQPTYKRAWKLALSQLQGGHSGEDIGKGRANAIKLLADILLTLSRNGGIELASFKGGRAKNVIASTAESIIVTDLATDTIETIMRDLSARYARLYGATEPSLSVAWEEISRPDAVWDEKNADKFLRFVYGIHSGVYESRHDRVYTSANLGLALLEGENMSLAVYARSFNPEVLCEFGRWAQNYAELGGFNVRVGEPSPCWHEVSDSLLADTMKKIFAVQNRRLMRTETIHAGLECGWFRQKNPKLDIVSIGASTQDIHSPQEKLFLDTIAPQAKLILATLESLAKS